MQRGIAPAGAPFIRYHVINMEAQMDISWAFPSPTLCRVMAVFPAAGPSRRPLRDAGLYGCGEGQGRQRSFGRMGEG